MPVNSFQAFGANCMIVFILTVVNYLGINCLAISFKGFIANRVMRVMDAVNPEFGYRLVSYVVRYLVVIFLMVDFLAILSIVLVICPDGWCPAGRWCLLGMGSALPHEGHQQCGAPGLTQEGMLQQEGRGGTLRGFTHQCGLQEADEAGRGTCRVAQLGRRH